MNRHYGGLAIKKEVFEELGGYCIDYQGWGLEDDDFLWKVSQIASVQLIQNEVIHLDHNRSHILMEDWNQNKNIKKLRENLSFKEVSSYDYEAYHNL